MKGCLIVIEGLDGSGKKTQSELLFSYLTKKNIPAEHISFPNYSSNSSVLVKMYLNSEFGGDPYAVNQYAAASFFAIDRYVSYAKQWGKIYERGDTVIADRYTTSNAIYQMAKLPNALWDGYLEWLYDYEYTKLQLPVPDLVIYLNMPVSDSQDFLVKRYGGDDSRKDLHENNVKFLEKCYHAGEYVCKKDNWINVNCTENGVVKTINDIHREIVHAYEKFFE